jgi:Rrf2 family protein
MRLALTKEAEYALRALVWLAQVARPAAVRCGAARNQAGPAGPPRHKAAEIARATGIPPVFALRVLANLQRQGLLSARAGRRGGYVLARPAGQITLLEAIEAVEGPLQTQECVLREAGCGSGGDCVLHSAWCAAQGALRTSLAQSTLAAATASPGGRTPSLRSPAAATASNGWAGALGADQQAHPAALRPASGATPPIEPAARPAQDERRLT